MFPGGEPRQGARRSRARRQSLRRRRSPVARRRWHPSPFRGEHPEEWAKAKMKRVWVGKERRRGARGERKGREKGDGGGGGGGGGAAAATAADDAAKDDGQEVFYLVQKAEEDQKSADDVRALRASGRGRAQAYQGLRVPQTHPADAAHL